MRQVVFFSFLLLLLNACGSYNEKSTPSISGAIVDNAAFYSDLQDNVLEMNVLIPNPNDYNCVPFDNTTAPSRACTLEDIIGDTDANDAYEPILHVQMSTNDFIVSNEVMNAEFEQKGKSTRNAAQKSFRIKLDSKTNLYKQERTFQLNKHAFDRSRVRNMLSFSFFREVPNFTSLRTQFVHLKINGTSYGLFTHVEKLGREYLQNRGWNIDDNLYKAQNFAFRYTNDLALTSKGTPVNQNAFDSVIEVERGNEQTKLIEMLKAVENTTTDAEFETVFAKYFNRENYITWMAINLIVANKDTVSQNFYLLNPLYSDTFYFLPWDYDGTSRDNVKYAKWELGIGTWWGIPLHKRFLKIQKNRDDLDAMVRKLSTEYITVQKVQAKLDTYRPIIEPYLTSAPDSGELDFNVWETEFLSLPNRLLTNINNYKTELGVPMPFWQAFTYDRATSTLTLKWDTSYDFEGDQIVYDIKCADNYDFNNSIIEIYNAKAGVDLNLTSWGEVSYSKIVPPITSGKHLYMQVIAKEENNASSYQIAFDKEVYDLSGTRRFGLLEFIVE
ncbi:CotH kinase family protein [Sulfurimonas sp. SAG-AH-194-L11]|nr:CotH kinase family protein [Sulfurimonas sp. SAG-AH-194-L11]MDF1877471.1 CotH kinase family protein [Sulfurimonas sp. SAG-AH-194-L11]